MKITSFFEQKLGAKLKNARYSWGAVDPRLPRVFLRVWKEEIQPDSRGQKAKIYWKQPRRSSLGYPERVGHIELLQNGFQGLAVLCTMVDPETDGPRKIKDFDDTFLLQLGEITEDSNAVYAHIDGRVPISRMPDPPVIRIDETRDVIDIEDGETPTTTTKETLVSARIGQGRFRSQVLRIWNNRCAVTGASTVDAIRASHIKPWKHSTNKERLDRYNGLPLLGTLDALFDAGLISFEDSGDIIISSKLSPSEQHVLGLIGRSLSRSPPAKTIPYLRYHRGVFFP